MIPKFPARMRSYLWRRAYRRRKAARQKARQQWKRRYYRMRQRLTEMPRLRSVQEYAAEAKRERPILRFAGANLPGMPTAMANREVLQRRYRRTMQFAGKPETTATGVYIALFIVASFGLGELMYLFETMVRDPLDIKPGHPLMYAGIAGGGGGMASLAGVYAIRFRRMWKFAYSLVHFVEHGIEAEPWRLTAVGRVWLVRLGYAAVDHGRMFSGGARQSGILEGNVIVELPPGMKAADRLKHIRDVYELTRKRGRFSGESTRALDGRVARVAGFARRRQALATRQRFEWLDRIGPWVVTVVSLIVMFLVLGGSST